MIDGCPGLYFKKLFPTWRKLLKASHLDPGSPLVLVITNSGARAVELNRCELFYLCLDSYRSPRLV